MIRAAGLLLGALLQADPARAASEEGAEVATFVFHALNLAVLLAVLLYFGRSPARKFFHERRQRVQGEIDRATALLEDAQARFSSWQRRLIELDRELAEIRETGRRRAEEERERILSDARARAERIRSEAAAAIEQELRRAREELREEAADLAIELAGELLTQELGDSDHDRLVSEFAERIEREPGAHRPPTGGS